MGAAIADGERLHTRHGDHGGWAVETASVESNYVANDGLIDLAIIDTNLNAYTAKTYRVSKSALAPSAAIAKLATRKEQLTRRLHETGTKHDRVVNVRSGIVGSGYNASGADVCTASANRATPEDVLRLRRPLVDLGGRHAGSE
jgi:hypothetical protein